jgi:transposase-like protein
MQTKKLIGAAAFSLALAGGGVAGAMFGSPLSSGAQEQTTTTNGTTGDAGAPDPGFPRKGEHPKLDAAAKAIGITVDELRTELEAGKTIAAVATEHNVSVDSVIDAMVTEATANLKDRITDLVNNGAPKPGPRARLHRFVERHEDFAKIAGVIGISEDDLKSALQSGQSIAQVAQAHDVDPQDVIDALVAEGVPSDRATNIVNHVGGMDHRGPGPDDGGPETTPSSTDA